MTIKVLMVNECSLFPTGYSVYGKEVLSRLYKDPRFHVAELACYICEGDERLRDIPWDVYANKPRPNDPELKLYNSNPANEFGDFKFNSVALMFKPDVVFSIRDFWMDSFLQTSPLRDYYNLFLMPTVDAEPSNEEWIDTYAQADGIFTYSEFGRDTLLNQCGSINHINTASPAASENFYIIEDKSAHRNKFGLDPDIYIIGTVMRNQRRKLYPDLFQSFRTFLNETGREDVYLYCHTGFPDISWSIPELILKYNLSNKVLFTYKCKACNHIEASPFHDAVKQCSKCNGLSSQMAGVSNGIEEHELNEVYNLFDIYVQYSNSEGFGMPVIEAASCGNVVCAVNYSAMESTTTNIRGIKLNPLGYYTEAESGCLRAIPDNAGLVSTLKGLTTKTKNELSKIGRSIEENSKISYNWDLTANKWADAFLNKTKPKLDWNGPSRAYNPTEELPDIKDPLDQANYLFEYVLGRPDWIGNYMWRRLLRDLTYRTTSDNINNGFYFNESHIQDKMKTKSFTFKDAYDQIRHIREYYNIWEGYRLSVSN
jgi:hypothetical protein